MEETSKSRKSGTDRPHPLKGDDAARMSKSPSTNMEKKKRKKRKKKKKRKKRSKRKKKKKKLIMKRLTMRDR